MSSIGQTVDIHAVGTAVPPCCISQAAADTMLNLYYKSILRPRSLDVLHQVLSHPSIKQRYVSVDRVLDLPQLKDENPDNRMARFTRWATDLSCAAVKSALGKLGMVPQQIDFLVVNTCTGYICPGISTYVVEKLTLPAHVKAYDCVGSGCGGAIPNLQLAQSLCASKPGSIAVSVSVEICSATFQMGDDMSLIISNAIFGDGAAAAVLSTEPGRLRLIDDFSFFDPSKRDDIRYIYKNGQLHNKLSQKLPGLIAEVVPDLLRALLKKHGLGTSDMAHWIIHPGGEKIISEIAAKLGLTDADTALARNVLLMYGNMSSPSVLFEMEQLLDKGIGIDDWVCMTAFGAGLSAYGMLLRGI